MQILDKAFDPSKLKAGVYMTAADTPAYPLLTAMAVAGMAKVEGVAFDADAREIKTFRVGKSKVREVAENPVRMAMSRRWLQNASLDYESWKEKWWRECIQNSADARATDVELYALKQSDGNWRCGCIDNGRGMSLDVLLNKFLVLGGTTKEGGSETSGGFGKAKELLLLPWLSYWIHSRDYLAVGSGDSFDVYQAQGGQWVWQPIEYEQVEDQWRWRPAEGGKPTFEPPDVDAQRIDGVHLEVLMPAEKYTTVTAAMVYAEKCFLPRISFKMTTNDPEQKTIDFKADLRNGRTLEEIEDKARIHYTKSSTRKPRCLVRTREGLLMFEEDLPYDVSGYVVVELLRPSVELLTSNRDGFSDYGLRSSVRAFLNNLARNTKSALSKSKNKITEVYQGEKFKIPDPDAQTADMIAAIGTMTSGSRGLGGEVEVKEESKKIIGDMLEEEYKRAEDQATSAEDVILKPNRETADAVLDGKFKKGQDASKSIAKQLFWTPAFIIHNEVEDYRVERKFRPEGMTPATLRLIKVWTELCRAVMIQLGCEDDWGVGFTFANDALAQCWRYEGVSWLMLNPYKSKDEIYAPSQEADRQLLFALAIHECTHIADNAPDHEETFTSAFTKNTALCAPLAKRLKRIVDSIPLRGQKEFDVQRKKSQGQETTFASQAYDVIKKSGSSEFVEELTKTTLGTSGLPAGTYAMTFVDDSVLTWRGASFHTVVRELKFTSYEKVVAMTRMRNGVIMVRLPNRNLASEAVALASARMFEHKDDTFVEAYNYDGVNDSTIFSGVMEELETKVRDQKSGSLPADDSSEVMSNGAVLRIDEKFPLGSEGLIFPDVSGAGHCVWISQEDMNDKGFESTEAIRLALKRNIYSNSGNFLYFTCSIYSRFMDLRISDSQLSKPESLNNSDRKGLMGYLTNNSRAMKWVRAFRSQLDADKGAYEDFTLQLRINGDIQGSYSAINLALL